MAVGSAGVVSGGGGPVLPATLQANTGLKVGTAVGVFDGSASVG